MVQLIALTIYKRVDEGAGASSAKGSASDKNESGAKAYELSQHTDLSKFSFLYKNTVKDHIKFNSRLIVSRTPIGGRQQIEFEKSIGKCYTYVHPSGAGASLITDKDYPMRVAFVVLSDALRIFNEKFGEHLKNIHKDTPLDFPEGKALLKKYQNPAEADKITKIEKDLDEVKGLVVKSMDDILQRGENLDTLMQKSEDLSTTSYQFYRQAKKNNQCCGYY